MSKKEETRYDDQNHNISSPILNLKKLLVTTVISNIAISLYTAFDSISGSKFG